jgi:hypothetical protein
MLEVIIAAIDRNLMNVYSGCLNFCNESCVCLFILDVSMDSTVQNILEMNGTVEETVKMINILRTNEKETSSIH